MKIIYTSLLLIVSLNIMTAQPSGYYNSANGKTGTDLELALHKIIRGHTKRSYSQLWTDFQTTDKKANGKVWDMYSDIPGGTPSYEYTFSTNQCGTYSTEGDCYNREHSFPKSWWGGGTSSTDTMYTDLFHIVPTDGYVNFKRGNYPFGETGSPTWTSTNGSKTGASNYPGYSGTIFEPIDDYKGDFARNYFYMATRYKNRIDSWGPNSDMLDGSEFSSWALNLLLEWHEQDPVSQKERNRNNNIYGIQGNRNPFIDHPEYVTRIWGGNDVYAPLNTDNYPSYSNVTTNGFTLEVNIDEQGTVYYVILSSGASQPSASQVKAGKDASGNSLSSTHKGSITVTSGFTTFSASVSGLSASTTYDVYFIAEDNAGSPNLQDNPVLLSISTSSSGGGGSSGSYYSELIITEYVEGSSYNKYLEIWNNTGSSVDLSDYSIKIYYNGNTSPGKTINLSGTLINDGIYVIANSSATAWSGTPDLSTGSLDFNGNDAVILVNNAAKGDVDVIGTVGSSSYFGKDKTLSRNTNATGPTTTYDASEWDNGSQNDVSGLGNEGPLPVTLIDFKASLQDDGILLSWTTATETNSAVFIVERSENGTNFIKIDSLTAAGNSNTLQYYFYKDNTSLKGLIYYRLRQIDINGNFYIGKTISLFNTYNILRILHITNNNSNLNIVLQSNEFSISEILCTDITGKIIYKSTIKLNKGTNNISIPFVSLSGIYLLKLKNENHVVVRKFVLL